MVRLFAAAGIVFVHAGESQAFDRWGNLFRFGVPFFLFASLFYQTVSLRRRADKSLTRFIFGRVERLYIPFLAWSAIYLVLRDLNRKCNLHQRPVSLHLSMLWSGTEYHLWFLPFLLICSIVLAIADRALFRHNPQLRWPAIGIAIGFGLAVAAGPTPNMPAVTESTFDSPTFAYIQWWLAVPAASWAFAFACTMSQSDIVNTVPHIFGIVGIILVVWCSVQQAAHGIQLAPRGLSGLGCMIAALSPWRGRIISSLARKGRMGYGIYLCHVFPVEVIHVISHRLHMPSSAWLDVLTFELSFLTAYGIVVLLSKSRQLAWLVG